MGGGGGLGGLVVLNNFIYMFLRTILLYGTLSDRKFSDMGCLVMGHLVMGRLVMGRFLCDHLK